MRFSILAAPAAVAALGIGMPSAADAGGSCRSEPIHDWVWNTYAPAYEPGQIHELTECNIPAEVTIARGQTFNRVTATS